MRSAFVKTFRVLYRYQRTGEAARLYGAETATFSMFVDVPAYAIDAGKRALEIARARTRNNTVGPVLIYGAQAWSERSRSEHWDAPGKGRFVA